MELLIGHGANEVSRGFYGRLPLHFAAYGKQVKAAKFLIDNEGHALTRDDGGWTPMDFAILFGSESMLKLFLKNGATIPKYSIQLAIKNHCVEMIQPLIENGLDVNETLSSLGIAENCGCSHCIDALKECIKFGAKTD